MDRLRRNTKLPQRLRDFITKNIPKRQGRPPLSPVLDLPVVRRRRRVGRRPSPAPSIVSPRRSIFVPNPNVPGPSGIRGNVQRRGIRRNLFPNSPSPPPSTPGSPVRNSPSPFRGNTPSPAAVNVSPRVVSPVPVRARRPRMRYVNGVNPVPYPGVPSPQYLNALRNNALKRVFTEVRKYKRNPVEINYDHNNIPHAIIRRKTTYTKVPSSYFPSNVPSNRIPLLGAFKSKTKILRRLKALKQLKLRAPDQFSTSKIDQQIDTFIKKYNTYNVNQAGSGFPDIERFEDI